VKQLVDVQHYGDAKNQTAIILYPKITDHENFELTVLSCFKFQEDISEIRVALDL